MLESALSYAFSPPSTRRDSMSKPASEPSVPTRWRFTCEKVISPALVWGRHRSENMLFRPERAVTSCDLHVETTAYVIAFGLGPQRLRGCFGCTPYCHEHLLEST